MLMYDIWGQIQLGTEQTSSWPKIEFLLPSDPTQGLYPALRNTYGFTVLYSS